MSQHYFNTTMFGGQAVTVTLGWDRRMDRFFFFIEGQSEKPLVDLTCGRSIDSLTEALSRHAVGAPPSAIEQLRQDQLNNAGNRFVQHFF